MEVVAAYDRVQAELRWDDFTGRWDCTRGRDRDRAQAQLARQRSHRQQLRSASRIARLTLVVISLGALAPDRVILVVTRMGETKSLMRETMWRQASDLERLLRDWVPVKSVAARLAGRRLLLVGTGTSWHAANHGVWFLREGGVDALAVQAVDVALYGPWAKPGDAVIVMSHGNKKLYTSRVIEQMRDAGIECLVITGQGVRGGDLETVEVERSAAFTASHLGALMRLAQLAQLLGANLGDLTAVPQAVAAALEGPGLGVAPPERILEFIGAGPNQWTAAEGALKVREACYVATEGLSVEQLLHGPGAALQRGDVLVALNGGGPGGERVEQVAAAGAVAGATVHYAHAPELGEHLSVFSLLVHVQRVALELAEALGINPDIFRRDQHTAWNDVGL